MAVGERRRKCWKFSSLVASFLIACLIHAGFSLWTAHSSMHQRDPISPQPLHPASNILQHDPPPRFSNLNRDNEKRMEKKKPKLQALSSHGLAGLSCVDHNGPDDEKAAEMVYWKDIPSDTTHESPFHAKNKYLTFEPDHGGFNNIRMAMETVIALAFAMGRTLVLPPAKHMYLLTQRGPKEKEKPAFTFADFFDMSAIHREHPGFDIISMEEFLSRQVARHNRHPKSLHILPPGNQTNFHGQSETIFEHLRKHVYNPIWDPNHCIAYFPESFEKSDKNQSAATLALFQNVWKTQNPKWEDFVGHPTPSNASVEYRLAEFAAGRKSLCLYDQRLQEEPVLHFQAESDSDDEEEGKDPRLLVHFYAFLFFENLQQDLWMKRFVRDHVRYNDDIQCAGARVVAAMREKATKHGKSTGGFQTMHVRRGDFQYRVTQVSAEEIVDMAQKVFDDGDVVYVATDEKDKTFFELFRKRYHVYFLDDFIDAKDESGNIVIDSKSTNPNYFGMIDQLVASRGKMFIGCWFSTFTGYIGRLRGYHSQKNKEPGYEDGKVMTSFYYAPKDRFKFMHEYYPVKKSFYAREFPTAWRMLDRSILTDYIT